MAVQRYTMNTVAIPSEDKESLEGVEELTRAVMRAPIMNIAIEPPAAP